MSFRISNNPFYNLRRRLKEGNNPQKISKLDQKKQIISEKYNIKCQTFHQDQTNNQISENIMAAESEVRVGSRVVFLEEKKRLRSRKQVKFAWPVTLIVPQALGFSCLSD